ncbi:MAG TPA: EthD domain-containing protein [Methylomirabilota bacterium]|nr:EthD domain-containing protein [Methylomirabilota bacterium]
MIKRISLLARKEGMTREQFTRHWLEVHAPLARSVPGLERYVQSHILEEFERADIPTVPGQIDGIAELWFEDRTSMERALASPEMAALHADGRLFIGANRTFVVEEKTIIG